MRQIEVRAFDKVQRTVKERLPLAGLQQVASTEAAWVLFAPLVNFQDSGKANLISAI